MLAPLAATLIAEFGWRAAARILAAVLVAGMVFAALLMRDSQLGTAAPDSQHTRTSVPTANWAKPVALAALALGTIAFYAGYAALLSQLSPLLADIGLAQRAVGYATGSVALCAIVGVLACGALTQYLAPRHAGAVILFSMAILEIGAASVGFGASVAALAGFVIWLGMLIGGGDPILIEALRCSVPLPRFGQAYGWWYLVCLAALAVTPVLAGAAFDRNANYRADFLVLGGISLVCAAIWSFAFRSRSSRYRALAA